MQGSDLVRAVGSTSGDVPLARQYHLDARRTVAATSLGSQALETRYSTDAFGNVLEGSAADNPAVYLRWPWLLGRARAYLAVCA